MRKKWIGDTQAALSLVAVVVGAGFASGREVLRFFTAFGAWSWAACVAAAAVMTGLSVFAAALAGRLSACDLAALSRQTIGGAGGTAAAMLSGALSAMTAGAMLAAMGELAQLTLPIRGAYWLGFFLSLAVGALAASRGIPALATIGGWLMPACVLLYALLLRLPPEAPIASAPVPGAGIRAIPYACAYAAMNAALSCGMLCELGQGKSRRALLRIGLIAGGLLLSLLLLANAALYPHRDRLQSEALPVVQLARSFGALGYWLCLVTLALAVETTLIALLRTLQRMTKAPLGTRGSWGLALLLPLLAGLFGFDALVGSVYPILGAISTLLFIFMIAKGGRRKGNA